jgi:hypothetical protein
MIYIVLILRRVICILHLEENNNEKYAITIFMFDYFSQILCHIFFILSRNLGLIKWQSIKNIVNRMERNYAIFQKFAVNMRKIDLLD